MRLVRSAAQNRIELTARRMSEFRAELNLQAGKFRHRIIGNEYHPVGDIFAVVVRAFHGVVVVAWPLTADRRSTHRSEASLANYTCAEQRQVEDAPSRRIRRRWHRKRDPAFVIIGKL